MSEIKPQGSLLNLDQIPDDILARCTAFIYASPANPQGHVATKEELTQLLYLAKKYDFLVFSDECYSEIYRTDPPKGIVEAIPSDWSGFENIIIFNSLSKRSSCPGLRVAFVAGDQDFIAHMIALRNKAAPQVPVPLQYAAIAAWDDEDHVRHNRALYNEKFALADTIFQGFFGTLIPEGGFFLWLDVSEYGETETLVKNLWQDQGVQVIPGEYLAMTDQTGRNPGKGQIRISLVDDLDTIETALHRIYTYIKELN